MTTPVVAVDLGGTNTRVALVGAGGDVSVRDVEPTARMDEHPEALVALVHRVSDGSGAARQ